MLERDLRKIEYIGKALDSIIRPELTREDKIIAESLRQYLEDIYISSKWYSCRYAAGAKIGVSQEKLSQNAEQWLETLEYKLSVGGTQTKVDALTDLASLGEQFDQEKSKAIMTSVFLEDRDRTVRVQAGRHLNYSLGYIFYKEGVNIITNLMK